jgi:hypothetical protein
LSGADSIRPLAEEQVFNVSINAFRWGKHETEMGYLFFLIYFDDGSSKLYPAGFTFFDPPDKKLLTGHV